MTQKAVVRRKLGTNRVEIAVKRASACGHNCADCAGCASIAHAPTVTAVAEDAFGARVGQQVTVETATKTVLWYAFLLYLLPFLGLFAAAAVLQGYGEGVAALGSVGVFIGVFAGVCLPLERWISRHKAVTYRVIAVEE